jgi:hypothetical protein
LEELVVVVDCELVGELVDSADTDALECTDFVLDIVGSPLDYVNIVL